MNNGSFFIPVDGGFQATESTRGPWSKDHHHGGPSAALMTRQIEHTSDMQLARMTI